MSAILNKSEVGTLKGIGFCAFSPFLKVYTLSVVLNSCTLLLKRQNLHHERENGIRQREAKLFLNGGKRKQYSSAHTLTIDWNVSIIVPWQKYRDNKIPYIIDMPSTVRSAGFCP